MMNQSNKQTIYDVAIIGAGAAGLMAALSAKRFGLSVLLLDGKEKIGAKILMSGGTRCNLTNQKITAKDFHTEVEPVLKAILASFSSQKAIDFFNELGVEVTLEDGGKYFPKTHSGRTVLEAFLREINQTDICLEKLKKVKSVHLEKGYFLIGGEGFEYVARAVILATGGLSFPATGSDGVGYEIAKSMGHSIITPSPALTPLKSSDEDWKKLSGVSLPLRLSLWREGRKEVSYEGSFLFTHFGFSGPVALNISRHWIRSKINSRQGASLLTANFLPQQEQESFRREILESISSEPSLLLKNFLIRKWPKRFAEVFLSKLKLSDNVILNQLTKNDREALIRAAYHCELQVDGDLGYAKAEVTAGGVSLAEVKKSTLESKLQPGLFFVGEILDVDGRIGGFNFQWAWASGFAAAQGVWQRLQVA